MEQVAALRAKGVDVISLNVGEPDFNTPEPIKQAVIRALLENKTHYGSNRGDPLLREKIARSILRSAGTAYGVNEILLTMGGAEGIQHAMAATLDPGDEAVIFTPAFLSYVNSVYLCGAKPVCVPVSMKNGFEPDADELRAAITPRTKLIVLNNPCNPTGAVYSAKALELIRDIAVEYDLYVFSDEIYARLAYDSTFYSMSSVKGMRERTVVLGGFSKTYAMTGWRVGWLAAPEPLATSLLKVHQYASTSGNTFIQAGLAQAMDDPETEAAVEAMRLEFDERRKILIGALKNVPTINFLTPQGAFYLFANVSGTGLSGEAFASELLNRYQVSVVPGDGFGDGFSNYIRISYATERSKLQEAVGRIAEFARGF
jgi:aspartate/methionine/tyrosine aminotransferase